MPPLRGRPAKTVEGHSQLVMEAARMSPVQEAAPFRREEQAQAAIALSNQ